MFFLDKSALNKAEKIMHKINNTIGRETSKALTITKIANGAS